MKRVLLLTALALPLAALPQPKQQGAPPRSLDQTLKVVRGPEGATGTAKLSQRILPNGNKLVTLSLTLKGSDGRTAVIQSESSYEPTGRPIRKIQRASTGGVLLQQITATFGESHVALTVQTKNAKNTGSLPYPKGSIEAKSEFWIIRDRPSPGSKSVYQRLNLSSLSWEAAEAVMKGPSKVKVAGKETSAILMTQGDIQTWLDSSGRVLRLESPSLVLEAVP